MRLQRLRVRAARHGRSTRQRSARSLPMPSASRTRPKLCSPHCWTASVTGVGRRKCYGQLSGVPVVILVVIILAGLALALNVGGVAARMDASDESTSAPNGRLRPKHLAHYLGAGIALGAAIALVAILLITSAGGSAQDAAGGHGGGGVLRVREAGAGLRRFAGEAVRPDCSSPYRAGTSRPRTNRRSTGSGHASPTMPFRSTT